MEQSSGHPICSHNPLRRGHIELVCDCNQDSRPAIVWTVTSGDWWTWSRPLLAENFGPELQREGKNWKIGSRDPVTFNRFQIHTAWWTFTQMQIKDYTCESTDGSIQQPLDNWFHLIQTPIRLITIQAWLSLSKVAINSVSLSLTTKPMYCHFWPAMVLEKNLTLVIRIDPADFRRLVRQSG